MRERDLIIMASGVKYSDEFKAEAVALVREGKFPVVKIASDLGIRRETLHTWIRNADKRDLSVDQVSESARNRELVKENARLKMEVELLKKASAYFAKECR